MFQFPGLAAPDLCIQSGTSAYDRTRLPDSEISGSTLVRSFPELFAAIHVLHRLSSPRHPPCALSSLTVSLRHVSYLFVRVQGSSHELRSDAPWTLTSRGSFAAF